MPTREEGVSEIRFPFGANWQSYLRSALDAERVLLAVASIKENLRVEDLSNKTFLDIGCGSGLFSLSACLLGASQVISFDSDVDSVNASKSLRSKMGIPEEKWQILHGSILQEDFIEKINRSDVVYAWGVLHHTGEMWGAIKNAASLVKPEGLFCIAIYNEVEGRILGSHRWKQIKRLYCRSGSTVRYLLFIGYTTCRLLSMILAFQNPITQIRNYKKKRGMSFRHNVVDWLGGYPYEYASAGAIFEYVTGLGPFRLTQLKTTASLGNNQFTFVLEGGNVPS